MKKNQEHEITWDDKKKSHSPPANRNQTMTQIFKKNKRQASYQSYPVTGINTTEVSKNDNDKDKT